MEFKRQDGKLIVEFELGLDLNKDGQSSIKAKLVVEGDEKEMTEEVVAALASKFNLPDWMKKAIGG